MMYSRRDVFRVGSLAWAAALAPTRRLFGWQNAAPQTETQPDVKFSSEVNVVNVFATVHDKQGKVIKNLLKDDFTLDEDGRPQTIKYFAQQSDLPLTLGLLVDTSGSQRRVLEPERRASYAFFDQVLREDRDKAFVIHFDTQVELLQDLTSSRKDLEKALDDLGASGPQLNRRSQGGGYPPGGRGGGYPQGRGRGQRGGGTLLYDAVLLASNEIMRKEQGRKAVILLTDGVDNGSKTSLSGGIEAAQRVDTLIYSIRFYDSNAYGNNNPFGGGPFGGGRRRGGGYPGGGYPQNRADGKKVLERMSDETGGGYAEVSDKDPLNKIYARIEDELRSQYSLGYTSDRPGSGYRAIHVGLKLKNLTVQARQGYYARGN
ncbi:MAG TPA: VWA domain-containing protein [Bryobacteraceae bacterium]|jgi:VWFA-related protein